MHTSPHTRTHTRTHTHTYMHTYARTHIPHTHTYTHMFITHNTHINTHTCINTHTHTHTHTQKSLLQAANQLINQHLGIQSQKLPVCLLLNTYCSSNSTLHSHYSCMERKSNRKESYVFSFLFYLLLFSFLLKSFCSRFLNSQCTSWQSQKAIILLQEELLFRYNSAVLVHPGAWIGLQKSVCVIHCFGSELNWGIIHNNSWKVVIISFMCSDLNEECLK